MAGEDSPVDAEFWTKKAGPLPVWAWVGAIGGGIGYYFLRQNRASASTVAPVAGSSDTGFGTTSPGVGGQSATPSGVDTVPVSQAPQDNNAWSIKAQNLLIAQGFDPATVSIALSNYLGGNNLTAQQQAIVSEALRSAGPTPEPVPPAVTPAPTPVPVTPTGPSVLWDTWKTTQDTTGTPVSGTQLDWGEIARRTLPATATVFDVYIRSLALQKQYPTIHAQYPMYVPASVAGTITYQGG